MNRLFIKALNSLGLIDFAIDRTIGDYRSSWDNMKKTGELPLPSYMYSILTQRCNLNCTMCHERDREKSKDLELDVCQFSKMIDNAGSIKTLAISGGEIFIRPDIFDILTDLDDRGIQLKISTNAYAINEGTIDKIKHLKNIKNFAISLDGPEVIHNSIRGKKDAFERTTRAIKLLKDQGIAISDKFERKISFVWNLVWRNKIPKRSWKFPKYTRS